MAHIVEVRNNGRILGEGAAGEGGTGELRAGRALAKKKWGEREKENCAITRTTRDFHVCASTSTSGRSGAAPGGRSEGARDIASSAARSAMS